MEENFGLEHIGKNYGWAFDGVPEENSLYLRYADVKIEVPSINLVHQYPDELLGAKVHSRFGKEFPIRFDYLDTMNGGNLSLQVHPLTEYIQEKFGMHYTQDESYYILDAKEGASVYLGVKENTDLNKMVTDLKKAQDGDYIFPDEKYVNKFPAKKHDHFLIPAGTVHCGGSNVVVLEISATSYIFTFKLWDWGRIGLDGKPRPVHIDHGKQNIQTSRTTKWVKELFTGGFGERSMVNAPIYINLAENIHIGNNVVIMPYFKCMSAGNVTIEDDVRIAMNVSIITNNHDFYERDILTVKDVHIGKNAWIGAGSTILPGVTIGENAIIGAGSVVTKDVKANTVVAGNPAKFIKEI